MSPIPETTSFFILPYLIRYRVFYTMILYYRVPIVKPLLGRYEAAAWPLLLYLSKSVYKKHNYVVYSIIYFTS
jgi:hypothetical protein